MDKTAGQERRGKPVHRAVRGLALAGCVLLVGCADNKLTTPTPMAPAPSSQAGLLPANRSQQVAGTNSALATRVEEVGRKLVLANPQMAMRPVFAVPGNPKPEISHQGEARLIISEGLVAQCKTEPELAALLSLELAKMVAEREGRRLALSDREPPPDLEPGNDRSELDDFRKAELAKLGYDRRRPSSGTSVPDPILLARQFLKKAGYPEAALEEAAPLLRLSGGS